MTDLLMGCPRIKSHLTEAWAQPRCLGLLEPFKSVISSPESEHASLQISSQPGVESELLSRSLSGFLLSTGEIIMLGNQLVCPAASGWGPVHISHLDLKAKLIEESNLTKPTDIVWVSSQHQITQESFSIQRSDFTISEFLFSKLPSRKVIFLFFFLSLFPFLPIFLFFSFSFFFLLPFFLPHLFLFLFFLTRSLYIAPAGLGPTEIGMVLLPSADIKGMYHYAWLQVIS